MPKNVGKLPRISEIQPFKVGDTPDFPEQSYWIAGDQYFTRSRLVILVPTRNQDLVIFMIFRIFGDVFAARTGGTCGVV